MSQIQDGSNDLFRTVNSCEEGFSYFDLKVYNRWGELVFYTDDINAGWDGVYKGRDAEVGVYLYVSEYVKEFTNEKQMLKGNVTLIR
ncbi:MAG: gliding motility-associated C-terminal domain-containing protein [Chitinophagales bacterium]